MKRFKTLKSYTPYTLLALVILTGCSELSKNTETFVVKKVIKTNKNTFEYQLIPTVGMGNLFIDSENFYNVGDTLRLKPN